MAKKSRKFDDERFERDDIYRKEKKERIKKEKERQKTKRDKEKQQQFFDLDEN